MDGIDEGGKTTTNEWSFLQGSHTESEISIASQPQAEGGEAKPEELPSQPSPPDPIIGRYRMTSSDGFDEVLRELGVGLMKRKMANSVTPINVIEIDEEGEFILFKSNICFRFILEWFQIFRDLCDQNRDHTENHGNSFQNGRNLYGGYSWRQNDIYLPYEKG